MSGFGFKSKKDTFKYTGSQRPGVLSPKRSVPESIIKPDYSADSKPKTKAPVLPWTIPVNSVEEIAGIRAGCDSDLIWHRLSAFVFSLGVPRHTDLPGPARQLAESRARSSTLRGDRCGWVCPRTKSTSWCTTRRSSAARIPPPSTTSASPRGDAPPLTHSTFASATAHR
jgi:hypothetical protein